MIEDAINDVVLNNAFSHNIYNTYLSFLKDADKREGFQLGKNNYQLLTEKEKYIIGIQKTYSDLLTTIEQINHIAIFLRRLPDKKFLKKNKINQLIYIQYHTEVLAHKVHTILEIKKLMVNEVYSLNINPFDCSWNKLSSRISKSAPPMLVIDKYFKVFENLIDLRHANTHRGVYADVDKDKIELDYGFGIYELHDRIGIKTDEGFKKLFPEGFIDFKIKEHRKNRIEFVRRVQSLIHDFARDFLASLNSELEKNMNKAL